jgi:thiol-disulfide isomerase/thioredoxin
MEVNWEFIRILSLNVIYFGSALVLFGIFIIAMPFIFKFKRRWIKITFVTVGTLFSIFIILLTARIHSDMEFDRNFFTSLQNSINNKSSDLEFTIISPDSSQALLSDFSGKIILLNYWATWCHPCIKEMPDFSLLVDNYNEDLVVICISDEEPGKVLNMVNDLSPLSQYFGVINDRRSIPDEHAMMLRIRPVTFIIDKEFRLQEYFIGAKEYDDFEKIILEYL